MDQLAIIKNEEFITTAPRALADTLISEGNTPEAKRVLVEAITQVGDDLDERLALLNSLCKVERAEGNYHEAYRIHTEAYPLSQLSRYHFLKWKFHNGLGITCDVLSAEKPEYTDRALIEFEAARFHAEQAGDSVGAGYAENNIAMIQRRLGRTSEAREHLMNARQYFTGQAVKLAEVDGTEAQVCLEEGKSLEALSYILDACRVFITHGEKKLLDDSIPTLMKAAADYRCEV